MSQKSPNWATHLGRHKRDGMRVWWSPKGWSFYDSYECRPAEFTMKRWEDNGWIFEEIHLSLENV